MATEMQNMLFKSEMPKNQFYEAAIFYKPLSNVGGDIYDYIKANDDEKFEKLELLNSIYDLIKEETERRPDVTLERFLENIETLIGRHFERIIMPGYELQQDEIFEQQKISEKRASKNRYRANQEKNQSVAKKKQASANKKYNAKIKKKR